MSDEKETVGQQETAEQELARLKEELAAEKESKAKLQEEAAAEIARLSEEVDSAKSDATKSVVTVTVKKKKYYLVGKRFNIPGKGEVEAADLIKDKPLLETLVEVGSGILVEAK